MLHNPNLDSFFCVLPVSGSSLGPSKVDLRYSYASLGMLIQGTAEKALPAPVHAGIYIACDDVTSSGDPPELLFVLLDCELGHLD